MSHNLANARFRYIPSAISVKHKATISTRAHPPGCKQALPVTEAHSAMAKRGYLAWHLAVVGTDAPPPRH